MASPHLNPSKAVSSNLTRGYLVWDSDFRFPGMFPDGQQFVESLILIYDKVLPVHGFQVKWLSKGESKTPRLAPPHPKPNFPTTPSAPLTF